MSLDSLLEKVNERTSETETVKFSSSKDHMKPPAKE
jgi:hypothetical protein